MSSPTQPRAQQPDDSADRVADKAEAQAAREEQDTEGKPEDPREPRDESQPFSGSEH